MPFHETIEAILQLYQTLKLRYSAPKFIIEENGFQAAYGQMLQGKGVIVKGIKNTNDKRSRLALTTYPMQNGTILFPKQGAEDLRTQLVGFGIERHDDLCDAFAMAVGGLVEEMNKSVFKVYVG
jgi:predicted phage terminase large subunit-like protein